MPDKLLPKSELIGVFDPEASQMGLRDKFEITVVRNYLWNNHEMSLKPVHNSMSSYDIVWHHIQFYCRGPFGYNLALYGLVHICKMHHRITLGVII